MKNQGRSLEDTIRAVHQKYKGRPSPLTMMNPNGAIPMAPQQQGTPPTKDLRSNLLAGFKPRQDTFR